MQRRREIIRKSAALRALSIHNGIHDVNKEMGTSAHFSHAKLHCQPGRNPKQHSHILEFTFGSLPCRAPGARIRLVVVLSSAGRLREQQNAECTVWSPHMGANLDYMTRQGA